MIFCQEMVLHGMKEDKGIYIPRFYLILAITITNCEAFTVMEVTLVYLDDLTAAYGVYNA